MRIERLTPDEFSAGIVKRLSPEGWLDGFDKGLHTLSDGGGVTLIDVKRIEPACCQSSTKLRLEGFCLLLIPAMHKASHPFADRAPDQAAIPAAAKV
ncbi:hypothetical protein [Mesorhizobium silamurunense]|uniref:hypothetical protein n=1 Tax=Mesorhizobium silamurunense TaxID=499528 RepID=UPI001784EB23|nr:hypothetical protein [Mesorhizobium silamurunense]